MKLKRLFLIPVIALAGTILASCTPAEIALFNTLSPSDQQAVAQSISTSSTSRPKDCYQAIEQVWPQSLHAWAKKIVWRESNNTPSAQNRSSSAAGCFQMTKVHAGRFQKLGYSWANDRYDAYANTRVALDLYREAGIRPWSL